MGEENKVFTPLNLLEIFKQQDNELLNMDQEGLNLSLSLGPSQPTEPKPENGPPIQNVPLNEDNYGIGYRQAVNDFNFGQNFGQQVLGKAVLAPLEVEAQMKKRDMERSSSFPEKVDEVRFGDRIVESVGKKAAFCPAMEKLKSAHAPESSNAARTASFYHPKANLAVNETGESAHCLYGNDKKKLLAKKAKVPSLTSGETIETPMSTLELMKHMPSLRVAGPTGIILEGVLFKYDKNEKVMVCLCHMYFLSPTDFVGHAGWGSVPNPLKHIKVFKQGI